MSRAKPAPQETARRAVAAADPSNFPAVTAGHVGGVAIQTVDARELHAFLQVGRDFTNWIKGRIGTYDFEQGVDYEVFAGSGENPSGGRPTTEYALTLDMAKELGMVENNERGRIVRRYFIECERRAQAADPVAALNDPAALRGLLLQNVDKVIALEAKVEADKPKADFYDQFVTADGLYGLQNAGRALGCHPNKFVAWLKQRHLFYQGGNLVPYAEFRQSGIFEVKVTVEGDRTFQRAFVTPKGLTYFAARIPSEIKINAPQELV